MTTIRESDKTSNGVHVPVATNMVYVLEALNSSSINQTAGRTWQGAGTLMVPGQL